MDGTTIRIDSSFNFGQFMGALAGAVDRFREFCEHVESLVRPLLERFSDGVEAGFCLVAGETRWKALTAARSTASSESRKLNSTEWHDSAGDATSPGGPRTNSDVRPKVRRAPIESCRKRTSVEEAVAKYHVSDRTLGTHIQIGLLTDFRPEGHSRNARLVLDDMELQEKFVTRQAPLIRKK